MSSPTGHVVWLLFAHFCGDFLAQSDEMAKKKAHSIHWLVGHVAIYTAVLAVMLLAIMDPGPAVGVATVNAILHMGTDACTGPATAALWKRGEVHWFFVVIGLDQLIHTVTLVCLVPA